MLEILASAGIGTAAARLAPVLARPDGEELVRLTALWFDHARRWDAAATAAGLHRYSLRARVERLAAELALEMDAFADRADLWALVSLHVDRMSRHQS